jgi:integrase
MGVIWKREAYWIDYRANGRRHRKRIGLSKSVAEAALNKILVEIAENKYLDIKKEPRVKFADFAKEYLETHSKGKKSCYTDEKIIGLLNRYFGNKYLYEIKLMDVLRFKNERAEQVKHGTVNRSLIVLRSMFNRAIEWGKATENPCKGVKNFKENNQRDRYLTEEEEAKLIPNCNEYLKAIIIVALHTGMRKGEILRLKWKDIDIEHRFISLYETKNGEGRKVTMNQTMLNTINGIPKHANSEYVFCNKLGKPYGDIKKSFLSAVQKASIINLHFHDLRHTFASRLVMAGVDLNTVRELLGHKSLEMTLRYSHLSPNHRMQAVNVLDSKMVSIWTPSIANVESTQNVNLANV